MRIWLARFAPGARLRAELARARSALHTAVEHHRVRTDELAADLDRAELARDAALKELDDARGINALGNDTERLHPPIGSVDYWRRRAEKAEHNCLVYADREAARRAVEHRQRTGAWA